MKYTIKEGDYSRMGTHIEGDTITFTFEGEKESDCAILLFAKNDERCQERIAVPPNYCIGSLRSVTICKIDPSRYDYDFEVDGVLLNDPYARKIKGREKWADTRRKERGYQIRSSFAQTGYEWKDTRPDIAKEDMIMYKLHVRSFTMDDPKTPAKKRGTFAGVTDKITYLKELGVTTVEFMPVYEFEEFQFRKRYQQETQQFVEEVEKVNMWGYGESNYFAPKASFAAEKEPEKELKDLIQKLHQNQMECIMEIYFDAKVNHNLIVEVLRYWVKEYHVDGFHLLGDSLPLSAITQDILLSRTKLFYQRFPDELQDRQKKYQNLYEYNDDFYYPVRKMLNHMGGDLLSFTGQMRKQRIEQGYVNYLASNNGFTLEDIFCYSEKHNERNMEENMDGNDWNFSSNYGIEGPTRKRFIQKIRMQQKKNAIAILFLSQGVPLLWAGDEWGNSQQGNNNAYCQDNRIGWINWRQMERNQDYLQFVKEMIRFRKAYPMLHRPHPMHLSDLEHIGYPDLSYHCDNAWVSCFEQNRQSVGVLFCKKTGEEEHKIQKIYLGFNFHTSAQMLALPQIPEDEAWIKVMDTSIAKEEFLPKRKQSRHSRQLMTGSQSVCILISQSIRRGKKNESF